MALRCGQKVPDWLASAPILLRGLDLYLNAFYDLNSDRSVGMSAGPIPWTAIHTYASAMGVFGVDFEDMVYLIRRLDNAYLEHTRPKSEP